MLSLYHRRLWDYYRIFGVENENYDLLKNEYIEYLNMNIKNGDKNVKNWFQEIRY